MPTQMMNEPHPGYIGLSNIHEWVSNPAVPYNLLVLPAVYMH